MEARVCFLAIHTRTHTHTHTQGEMGERVLDGRAVLGVELTTAIHTLFNVQPIPYSSPLSLSNV